MLLVDGQILTIEQLEKVLVLMSRLQHTKVLEHAKVSLKIQQFVINLHKQRTSSFVGAEANL